MKNTKLEAIRALTAALEEECAAREAAERAYATVCGDLDKAQKNHREAMNTASRVRVLLEGIEQEMRGHTVETALPAMSRLRDKLLPLVDALNSECFLG